MSKVLVLKPRLSEKAYAQSESLNTYVVDVPDGLNRQAVAKAIETQFSVSVTATRMVNFPGKTRRGYRRRGRVAGAGTKGSDIRKAYITLKEGDKLPVFAAVEEAEKKEEKKK